MDWICYCRDSVRYSSYRHNFCIECNSDRFCARSGPHRYLALLERGGSLGDLHADLVNSCHGT